VVKKEHYQLVKIVIQLNVLVVGKNQVVLINLALVVVRKGKLTNNLNRKL